MFWIGLGIGTVVGAIIGIMCVALVTVSQRNEREDKEQVRYIDEQKDRNEF